MVEFILINGANLAYNVIGPVDAPLFITLHGGRGFGMGSRHLFIHLIAHFSPYLHFSSVCCLYTQVIIKFLFLGDHKSDFHAYSPLSDKYRVLSFDFRGHGQSSDTPPFTFRQLVDDIEALRRHFAGSPDNNNARIILCGGSFGGYLAQQYAIEYLSHVSHLILRGTAPSYHRKRSKITNIFIYLYLYVLRLAS